MTAQLIQPSLEYQRSYEAYIRELGTEVRYPFPMSFDHSDFPKLLARLEELRTGTNIPDGFVPSSTNWLVQGDELLAVSNLRHHLNDRLKEHGGHIGIGVRPGQRGKGLGKLILKLTVAEARKRGIDDVHVHCHKHNEASARMIIANGGVLHSEVAEPDGKIVQRYIVRR